jgi:hypothetical protein
MVRTGTPERRATKRGLDPFLDKSGRWELFKVAHPLGIALTRSR